MTRITLRTLLAFALVGAFTLTAQAKDPFNQLGDIQGNKLIIVSGKPSFSKGPWMSKFSYKKVEFIATSGEDLLAIDGWKASRVQVAGYGSGHFLWELDGEIYEITNYPYDNKHKAVSGVVHHENGKWSKFQLVHRKTTPSAVAGNWSGELAFIGGGYLRFSLQVANVPSKCGSGDAYTRVNFLGFPSQPANISCNDSGTFYSQFFFWDETKDGVFFITITGEVTEDGEIFQGQSTAWDLYGGTQKEGKFLLFRPEGLVL